MENDMIIQENQVRFSDKIFSHIICTAIYETWYEDHKSYNFSGLKNLVWIVLTYSAVIKDSFTRLFKRSKLNEFNPSFTQLVIIYSFSQNFSFILTCLFSYFSQIMTSWQKVMPFLTWMTDYLLSTTESIEYLIRPRL